MPNKIYFDIQKNIANILNYISLELDLTNVVKSYHYFLNINDQKFETGETSFEISKKLTRVTRDSFFPFDKAKKSTENSLHFYNEDTELILTNPYKKGLGTSFDIKFLETIIKDYSLNLKYTEIGHDHWPSSPKRRNQLDKIGIQYNTNEKLIFEIIGSYYAKFLNYANTKKGILLNKQQQTIIKLFPLIIQPKTL